MANLLIVDDDKDLCEVISFFLESYFESIVFAHSVPEAIGKIKTTQFNLIVVDLNLISGSGTTVVKYSRREDSPNSHTPIIVVSGEQGFRPQEYPFTEFLSKPFDEEAILAKIKKLKGSKSSGDKEEITATHPELLKLLKGSR